MRCTNANRGTFNHECGKPAVWAGTHPSGYVQMFCERCRENGDEAKPVVEWSRIDAWRVEWWEISGVHTGWRVVRGHGQQKEYGQGFAFDRYKAGDYERQEKAAKRWCEQLNSGEIEEGR